MDVYEKVCVLLSVLSVFYHIVSKTMIIEYSFLLASLPAWPWDHTFARFLFLQRLSTLFLDQTDHYCLKWGFSCYDCQLAISHIHSRVHKQKIEPTGKHQVWRIENLIRIFHP